MERKLASIRTIRAITPIENADAIELASVDGWDVVVKKNQFEVGEFCVYFEIDSFLPIYPEFEFLRKSCYRSNAFMGEGFRIKTIKLRGQISQGFISSIKDLAKHLPETLYDGFDCTESLGVKKWEQTLHPTLSGQAKGLFPAFIPKTDQERIQNIGYKGKSGEYEVSLKLDGSSITMFVKDGVFGVCSRNLELKTSDEDSTFVKVAKQYEQKFLQCSIECDNLNFAVQGELMGPGIQGNRENLKQFEVYVFDVYNIDARKYIESEVRKQIVDMLEMKHVPVFENQYIDFSRPNIVKELLEMADGPSLVNPVREGLVFKMLDGSTSFKAISNKFLLSSGD